MSTEEDRAPVTSGDGSATLWSEQFGQHYHSIHGAQTESQHVFIEAGLAFATPTNPISILEVGLGTGLNVGLTETYAAAHNLNIEYHALEKFPLTQEEARAVCQEHTLDLWPVLSATHNTPVKLGNTTLTVFHEDLLDWEAREEQYHLIYFDAFSPNAQPELWSTTVFEKMYHCLKPGGILTTYCAKGIVKRAMKSAGFEVSKLPGPPRKREMTRAQKPA